MYFCYTTANDRLFYWFYKKNLVCVFYLTGATPLQKSDDAIIIKLYLMLSMLGKISADDTLKYFSLFSFFSSENRIWHFMQSVSIGDNFHEMLAPVFWEK